MELVPVAATCHLSPAGPASPFRIIDRGTDINTVSGCFSYVFFYTVASHSLNPINRGRPSYFSVRAFILRVDLDIDIVQRVLLIRRACREAARCKVSSIGTGWEADVAASLSVCKTRSDLYPVLPFSVLPKIVMRGNLGVVTGNLVHYARTVVHNNKSDAEKSSIAKREDTDSNGSLEEMLNRSRKIEKTKRSRTQI